MKYVITCPSHEVSSVVMDDLIWELTMCHELKKVYRKLKTVYDENGDCYWFISSSPVVKERLLQGLKEDEYKCIPYEIFNTLLNNWRDIGSFKEEIQQLQVN